MAKPVWLSKANKQWGRKAEWIEGDGQFAVLAHCRVLTVTLWPSKGKADDAIAFIDQKTCGGACKRNHEIIDLSSLR